MDTQTGSIHYTWIDYVKFLSIFLVVFYHCPPPFTHIPHLSLSLLRIPCFFFISGLLFRFEKYPSFLKFVKRRSKQLLVPYFCFFCYFLRILVDYREKDRIGSRPKCELVPTLVGISLRKTQSCLRTYVVCILPVRPSMYFLSFIQESKKQDIRSADTFFTPVCYCLGGLIQQSMDVGRCAS